MRISINRITTIASTFYKDRLSTTPSRFQEANSTIKHNCTTDTNYPKQKMRNVFSKYSFNNLIHGHKKDIPPNTGTTNNIVTIDPQIIQKPIQLIIVKTEIMEHPANRSNLNLDFTDRTIVHKYPDTSTSNNITNNYAAQEKFGIDYI